MQDLIHMIQYQIPLDRSQVNKQTKKKNNYCSFNDNENGEIAAH